MFFIGAVSFLILITFTETNGRSLQHKKYEYELESTDKKLPRVELNIEPSVVFLNQNVEFVCNYSGLEKQSLYSIKWYRNDKEFFRYVPREFPQVQHFSLKGITLATPTAYEMESDVFRLIVSRVNLDTQGTFRCEVATDAPHFAIYKDAKTLEVNVLPSKSPRISGSRSSFLLKSRIDLNCSAPRSKPVCTLEWFINDHKAPSDYLITYPTLNYTDGLQSQTLRLKFIVNDQNFEEGNMKLKCVAYYKKFTLGANETFSRTRGSRRQKPGLATTTITETHGKDSSESLAQLPATCLAILSIVVVRLLL